MSKTKCPGLKLIRIISCLNVRFRVRAGSGIRAMVKILIFDWVIMVIF